jgi:formyltetrahydrofolate-dependent phosphoribosylglycinamide formyltransferase
VSLRVAVFASGGGSNLQALLDHFPPDAAPATVALVVSDREDAGALTRARAAGVPARVIPTTRRDAATVGEETLAALALERIDIVALAGYLRLVPPSVVHAFRGRIVNVHPALLPAFGGTGMYGMNVHRAVLAAGCFVTGATIHHVDENYDEGRIIAQWPVPVLHGDTPESLAARVLRVEHILYPAALALLTRTLLDGAATTQCAGYPASTFAFGAAAEEADAARIRRTLGLD